MYTRYNQTVQLLNMSMNCVKHVGDLPVFSPSATKMTTIELGVMKFGSGIHLYLFRYEFTMFSISKVKSLICPVLQYR